MIANFTGIEEGPLPSHPDSATYRNEPASTVSSYGVVEITPPGHDRLDDQTEDVSCR